MSESRHTYELVTSNWTHANFKATLGLRFLFTVGFEEKRAQVRDREQYSVQMFIERFTTSSARLYM